MSKVSVTVIKPFRDKKANNDWKSSGYVYEVSEERAKELEEAGYVTTGEADTLKEKVNQGPTEKNKNAGPNPKKSK